MVLEIICRIGDRVLCFGMNISAFRNYLRFKETKNTDCSVCIVYGWNNRIRTCACLIQSQEPYRLAIFQNLLAR